MTQEKMTAVEYQVRYGSGKQPAKYRNQKTVVDGMLFDSQKEANYYCELKLQKRAGEIVDFFLQVPFLVQEGYYKGGEWIKPIYYVADFLVIKNDNDYLGEYQAEVEVHEAKGHWTKEALLKKKLFEGRYPEYKFVVV